MRTKRSRDLEKERDLDRERDLKKLRNKEAEKRQNRILSAPF